MTLRFSLVWQRLLGDLNTIIGFLDVTFPRLRVRVVAITSDISSGNEDQRSPSTGEQSYRGRTVP